LSSDTELASLADLCGLRSAPALDGPQRDRIRQELKARLAACTWFTVGVMAPSQTAALAALRGCEHALGWEALVGDGLPEVSGPVFLKGNQNTGLYRLRSEHDPGEGLLITGHHATLPEAEGTWGPLPLNFFA
jgi:hypothetical protein